MALPARLQPVNGIDAPGIGACCASIRTIARLSAQASAWHPRPRRVCSLVKDRAPRYPKERVAEYSNAICLLIRAATIGQGAGFLDLRPAIRSASARDILHGPRDFKHFNRKGMEVLGQTVAERMDQPLAQESCANYR